MGGCWRVVIWLQEHLGFLQSCLMEWLHWTLACYIRFVVSFDEWDIHYDPHLLSVFCWSKQCTAHRTPHQDWFCTPATGPLPPAMSSWRTCYTLQDTVSETHSGGMACPVAWEDGTSGPPTWLGWFLVSRLEIWWHWWSSQYHSSKFQVVWPTGAVQSCILILSLSHSHLWVSWTQMLTGQQLSPVLYPLLQNATSQYWPKVTGLVFEQNL